MSDLNRLLPLFTIIALNIGINSLYKNTIPCRTKNICKSADFYVSATAIPDTICPGMSSQLMASPTGGILPITYLWSPETGLDDPTSQNPVASPVSTTTYTVIATDISLQVAIDSVEVFVKEPPQAPGPISGPNSVCHDSTETYSIAEVYDCTSYSWTIPEGDTILNGQNTTQVEIKWSGQPGPVSVIAGNECGNSNPSVLIVTIEQIPEIIGTIEGPDSVCVNEKTGFYIPESPGATNYIWTVPDDALINSGQGTDSIDVTWGASAGDIVVTAENLCGQSEPVGKSILLEEGPDSAGMIIGRDTVCLNHANYFYSIPPVPDAISYQWDLPEGAIITDGKETNIITVFFSQDATSGMIHVSGVNRCGNGDESTKKIIANPCTSISEYQNQNIFYIYPNPADNEINIFMPGNKQYYEIIITDITGRIQYFEEGNNINEFDVKKINISKLFRGIYFICFKGSNEFTICKLIKK